MEHHIKGKNFTTCTSLKPLCWTPASRNLPSKLAAGGSSHFCNGAVLGGRCTFPGTSLARVLASSPWALNSGPGAPPRAPGPVFPLGLRLVLPQADPQRRSGLSSGLGRVVASQASACQCAVERFHPAQVSTACQGREGSQEQREGPGPWLGGRGRIEQKRVVPSGPGRLQMHRV